MQTITNTSTIALYVKDNTYYVQISCEGANNSINFFDVQITQGKALEISDKQDVLIQRIKSNN